MRPQSPSTLPALVPTRHPAPPPPPHTNALLRRPRGGARRAAALPPRRAAGRPLGAAAHRRQLLVRKGRGARLAPRRPGALALCARLLVEAAVGAGKIAAGEWPWGARKLRGCALCALTRGPPPLTPRNSCRCTTRRPSTATPLARCRARRCSISASCTSLGRACRGTTTWPSASTIGVCGGAAACVPPARLARGLGGLLTGPAPACACSSPCPKPPASRPSGPSSSSPALQRRQGARLQVRRRARPRLPAPARLVGGRGAAAAAQRGGPRQRAALHAAR